MGGELKGVYKNIKIFTLTTKCDSAEGAERPSCFVGLFFLGVLL